MKIMRVDKYEVPCYNTCINQKEDKQMITSYTNVRNFQIEDYFKDKGYEVKSINFFLNGIDDPTVYPECYKYNMPYLRSVTPIRGGVWQITLQNPNLLEEPNKPYIYCSLYDLKVEVTCDPTVKASKKLEKIDLPWQEKLEKIDLPWQEKIEKIWFEFVNEIAKESRKIDLTKKEVREKFIEQSTRKYNEAIEKQTPTNVFNMGIHVPSQFNSNPDPKKSSFESRQRVKSIIKEAQRKQEQNAAAQDNYSNLGQSDDKQERINKIINEAQLNQEQRESLTK